MRADLKALVAAVREEAYLSLAVPVKEEPACREKYIPVGWSPNTSWEYRCYLGGATRTPALEDENLVEAAAVSLGMGTRMLPSARYGSGMPNEY